MPSLTNQADRKNERRPKTAIDDGSFVQNTFRSSRKDKLPKFTNVSEKQEVIETKDTKKLEQNRTKINTEIYFDINSLGSTQERTKNWIDKLRRLSDEFSTMYCDLVNRQRLCLMNFGCTSNKKRRLKDENKNPSKMVPANKLKRKAEFKLSESLNTNTESSYPNSRNRKKVLTPLDLSEGDKVFVKSNDRSFHEASFVKKSADHFIIKLKNGDDIRVEGTKLRLISQPSRSKTPNEEPILDESLTSSSPISIRKTRASTKKVQTNDKIQKKHSQLDQEDSLTTLDKPVIYERDSVVTPALIEQSNDLTGSNEDFSCPSVKNYDLSNINNQSENEKSISEPNEEMDAAPGEEQHVSDAVNCACGIHDDQQEMVKCIQCMKMQHVNCLNLGQGPHTCFNCSKELFKIDDVFYYNFFISQNGMFPDPVLNKYCGISTEHASLFRSISQCIEKLESNLEITDDIGDLERRLSEVFSFPTLAQIDEIIPTENNAQLHKYLKTYFIENS